MPGSGADGSGRPVDLDERGALDETLLGRIRDGDQRAFAELVGVHFDAVYRVAWRTLGGSDGAEDVAQEAFLRLWRNPQQLRSGAAVRAWLMRVASNLAIDRHRRRGPIVATELPDVADDSPGADADVRRRQVSAEIDAAVTALPERQRMALVLCHFEGLGNKEIAEAMDLTVEAVESLLGRARRALRASLAGRWRDLLGDLESL
ncbi:MAG: sigma-70 family RNA polymerase sigma factor [Parvibaculaceae bacterium]